MPVVHRSAFAGFWFPPEVTCWRSAGICGAGCRLATSRNCLPSAVSMLITSRCSVGCNAHAAVRRRGNTVPAYGRGSMVRRRDLRQSRRQLALRLRRYRRIPPGHRRPDLPAPRHNRSVGARHRQADPRRGAQLCRLDSPLFDRVKASSAEFASPLFGGLLPVISACRQCTRSIGVDRLSSHHGLLE